MRVLVCGGRCFDDKVFLFSWLDKHMEETRLAGADITEVVHGGAPGADRLAGEWATERGLIETSVSAKWSELGRAAGPVRNATMLHLYLPEQVIAFPGGRGTENMVSLAKRCGVRVFLAER